MAKEISKALAGFIGAIIGFGLFALVVYLSTFITVGWAVLPMSVGAWLIGGFIAGLIAKGPGRGALAGLFMSVFTFVIYALLMVIFTVAAGSGLFIVLIEVLTLGLYDGGSIPTELVIMLVLIGLLIAFIFSVISAVFNISAGAIGGLITNPNKKNKDAYQDYPAK